MLLFSIDPENDCPMCGLRGIKPDMYATHVRMCVDERLQEGNNTL